MNKNRLAIGQKVHCKETGLEVEVSDLSLEGNKVGIVSGCVAKIVDASVLEPILVAENVEPTEPVTEERNEAVETQTNIQIKMRYDDGVNALYFLINDKVTICVNNVSPNVINTIGISSCNDTDVYNKEIGDALAFKRACERENEADKFKEENEFLKFLEMMNDVCEEIEAEEKEQEAK